MQHNRIVAGYIFHHAVRRFADHTAIVDRGRRLTYTQLNKRVNRLGNALMKLGMKPGDRIAQFMHNCGEYVEVHFAAWKCGIVRVPLNIRGSRDELIDWLNDSQSDTIIFSAAVKDLVMSVKDQVWTKNFICVGDSEDKSGDYLNYEELLAGSSEDEPMVEVSLEDPCRMQYTSGTTGKLKAAVISYGSEIYINELYLLNSEIDITHKDAMLHVAPMSHASGLYSVRMFIKGAKQIILEKFDPLTLLESVEKEKATILFLVPTMIYSLLEYPDISKYDLSSIRLIEYGASPMTAEKLKEAVRLFGNVFSQWYGLSEAPAFVLRLNRDDHMEALNNEHLSKRLMAAGRIDYGPELRLVDQNGNDVPAGTEGEIIVRGRQVMTGYWRAPELTKSVIIDGWLHTGDIARMDEDGFVYIVGRSKDMIITGGFNVYPREIEEVMQRHPAVNEVAVIGVPDAKWGEAIKACVVLKDPQTTEEELLEFCYRHLPRYKVPKSVDFVSEIPKNAYGKVQKNVLREKYWAGMSRNVN